MIYSFLGCNFANLLKVSSVLYEKEEKTEEEQIFSLQSFWLTPNANNKLKLKLKLKLISLYYSSPNLPHKYNFFY